MNEKYLLRLQEDLGSKTLPKTHAMTITALRDGSWNSLARKPCPSLMLTYADSFSI
ncbi:hypothetical protein QMP26_28650 [Enterocloster clostridioformis]